ncbi:dna-directed rna polymerase ii rpbabc8 [Cystoisospora suis]|uniref:Dna-directed rna polymerase ii rpbabc8 n=1 Tax=Cystoisospora suis TaxID=483139 RepID=A0A2C6KR70_9APIC|nr:dna-directed rna polymerase ii rpbabc8 [Cystoisospora suis]
MSIPCLFEDRFEVRSVDNSKFETVSRIKAKSSGFDADIQLDINSHIFPVKEKQRLYVGLTNTLLGATASSSSSSSASRARGASSAGGKDYGAAHGAGEGMNDPGLLFQEYDYVMYGKIFRTEESSSERRTLYASFGGLLMALTADKHVVGDLELDMRIYLLLRRSDEGSHHSMMMLLS